MRTSLLRAFGAVALVGIACSDDVTDPARNFESAMSGANEVPAVNSTAGATGTYSLVGGAGGTDSISYTLTITSPTGSNITQAHIHLGNAGAAGGGPVIWLCKGPTITTFPAGTPDCLINGTANGVLVTGKMPTGADAATRATNVAAIRGFGAYANIHTVTNGSGELRGQLRIVGQ